MLLEPFGYGPEFLRLNEEVFELYAEAVDSDAVRAAERRWLEQRRLEAEAGRAASNAGEAGGGDYYNGLDLPPGFSDEGEGEEEEGDGRE